MRDPEAVKQKSFLMVHLAFLNKAVKERVEEDEVAKEKNTPLSEGVISQRLTNTYYFKKSTRFFSHEHK